MRYTLITKSEVLVCSFTVLIVIGLVYKGVASMCDDRYNPVFHGALPKNASPSKI